MKVLIAIDQSEASDDALDMGLDLIRPDDETIVLSVAGARNQRLTPLGMMADQLEENFDDSGDGRSDDHDLETVAASTDIVETSASAAEALNADETLVLEGDPAARIVDAARLHNVDLIIVGRSERGAVARFFNGSVSQHVLDNAPCSVLVAR